MPPMEERVEYPYQNLRTRNFFWGDGDKVSFLRPIPTAAFSLIPVFGGVGRTGLSLVGRLSLTMTTLQTLFWNEKVNYHNKDKQT